MLHSYADSEEREGSTGHCYYEDFCNLTPKKLAVYFDICKALRVTGFSRVGKLVICMTVWHRTKLLLISVVNISVPLFWGTLINQFLFPEDFAETSGNEIKLTSCRIWRLCQCSANLALTSFSFSTWKRPSPFQTTLTSCIKMSSCSTSVGSFFSW